MSPFVDTSVFILQNKRKERITIVIAARLGMLLLMILIGFMARKLKLFDGNAQKPLGAVVYNISLPLMVFCSVSSTLTKDLLQKAGIILILALSVYLGCLFLSFLYVKLLKVQDDEKGIHQYCFSFSNVAFIGMPLVKAFWGDEGIIFVSIFTVVFSSLNNSIGISLLSTTRKRGNPFRVFKAPPFWGVMTGILFGLLGIKLPEIMFSNLQSIGNMTTPLAMIFTGLTVADSNIAVIGKYKKAFITILFRLLIIPAVFYLILQNIFSDYYIYSIPTLIVATPFATTLTIMAEKNGASVELASFISVSGVICSMITIPIWALVLT